VPRALQKPGERVIEGHVFRVQGASKSSRAFQNLHLTTMANWTANSNEVLHLSLGILLRNIGHFLCSPSRRTVRANDDKEVLGDNESYENFHPSFTYPVRKLLEFFYVSNNFLISFQIYGEDEKIYGYTDLRALLY
jgi:hypothetical protein